MQIGILNNEMWSEPVRIVSVRDIRSYVEELHGLKGSPGLLSRVTDTVLDEVK